MHFLFLGFAQTISGGGKNSPSTSPTPPTLYRTAMAPQNVSTQPTAAPAMQMTVQPSIEDAQSQKQGIRGKFEAMRLRGGGAGKDCFLGAIGCFLCCEVSTTKYSYLKRLAH
ncbi:hypothetical protein FRC12_013485 [Ceratobasidium sp. 428]|nr:hypothetical protein FRC12_013485 [Ceratobasidium sp. 428]